jgi:crossover junction endodeoxyribonuclease RuvC
MAKRTSESSKPVRLLGVDPGSQKTGWGVIEICYGTGQFSHVDNGVLMLDRNEPLVERLVDLSVALHRLVKDYKPDRAAVEDVFLAKSAKSALVLGQARGVVLASIGLVGVPINSYSSTRVKSLVTGQGRAGKDQVAHWVCQHLSLPEKPFEDAADALAVAICLGMELFSPVAIQEQNKLGPVKARRSSRRSIEALARAQGKL